MGQKHFETLIFCALNQNVPGLIKIPAKSRNSFAGTNLCGRSKRDVDRGGNAQNGAAAAAAQLSAVIDIKRVAYIVE